ncbi:MAG: 2Fe-2S iron-sulfur cluster binding domain-containing protein, partial [Planctomycetales bacterium]|nr:2Fe-2S iron-sulfur cluster binding domain-containing protein [Planctomycetales bacterium]
RPLRVAAVVDECDGVKSFYFASPDGRPLPRFLPGQYLTLHLPIESGGKQVVRCYSLSDRAREEYFRCTIKRQGPPSSGPDLPPGVGSNYLHDHVVVDDLIDCEAPRGPFYLSPRGAEPVVLIGSGIGLTPMVSMVSAIAQHNPKRDVYLFAGVRNRREFPFREYLRRLAEELKGLRLYVAYSRPDPRDVQYNDYHHAGRVTMEYLQEVLPSSNFPFYLCGPPEMMQSLAPGLLEWGVPDDMIHFEAFGPASVRLPGQRNPAAEAVGEHVRFERQHKEYVWEAEDASILDLALKHHTPIETGCRAGNCGQCAVRVLSGKTTTLKTPGATVPAGHCLACVSVPVGPVVLDV